MRLGTRMPESSDIHLKHSPSQTRESTLTSRASVAADLPLVSVVTVTKDREESLVRCAESVAAQDYFGPIEHVIVVDDRYLADATLAKLRVRGRGVRVTSVRTSENIEEFQSFFTVSRIGYLRNRAITLCRGEYVAYLDDDNTYLPEHISTLVDLLERDETASIAYSWRYLLQANGDPYEEPRYPWTPWSRLATDNDRFALHIHQELLRTGIRVAGDHIQRDAVIAADGEPVHTVDTSELLVRRQVHSNHRWVTRFTWREMTGDYSDDYAFVKQCHEAGLRFVCSRRPTVNYYLDGVSNRPRPRTSRRPSAPLVERMRDDWERCHSLDDWRPEMARSLPTKDGGTFRLFRTEQRFEYNRRCRQAEHTAGCALCAEGLNGIVFLDRVLIVPDPVPFARGHFLLRFLRGHGEAAPRALFESRSVTEAEQDHRETLIASDVQNCLLLAEATGDLICLSLRGSGASFPQHLHAHAFRLGRSGSLKLPQLEPSSVRLSGDVEGVRLSVSTTAAFGVLLEGQPKRVALRLIRAVNRLALPVNLVAGHGGAFPGTWCLAFWREKECPSHPLFWDHETGPWRFGFSEMLGLFEVKSVRQFDELTPDLLENALRETTVDRQALRSRIEEALSC